MQRNVPRDNGTRRGPKGPNIRFSGLSRMRPVLMNARRIEEIGRAQVLDQLQTIPRSRGTMYRVQFTACVNFAELTAARR